MKRTRPSTTARPRRTTAGALTLTLAAATLPALAAPAGALEIGEGEVEIQVLGITDYHGRLEANFGSRNLEGGAAVLAGAVKQLRAETPNTVFVSAGDNIGASTFTSFVQGDTPTILALNEAGLDVSAVGNHEFDRGFTDLTDRIMPDAMFPYLGANVYAEGTTTPVLDEYEVVELDGVSVGFIGVVTPQTATMVAPSGIEGIVFGDMVEAANRVAAQLSDGDTANGEADVLFLLAHEGANSTECGDLLTGTDAFSRLVQLADPRIDAIHGGHTHRQLSCSVPRVDLADRAVVQAGQYGTHLSQVLFAYNPELDAVTAVETNLLPLVIDGAGAYPADPVTEEIVADAVEVADELGSVEVGAVSADITRAFTAEGAEDRGAESSLGNLVADMQLWATSNEDFGGEPAEIAFMNPGGLRADLLYGEDGVVTYREAASVQPFANTLVTMNLTGAQIKSVLEEQWQPEGASRPYLHLGVSEGFSYIYDADAPAGERIVYMELNGVEIDPAATYRVTVNSFLASGGDNFFTFAEGTDVTDTGQVDLVAAVAFFEAMDVVTPPAIGRAVAYEEPVDPTDPPVDPTDPPVDPTDPPVDPTDPPVDPTDPPVDPTDPPADDDEVGDDEDLADTGTEVGGLLGLVALLLVGGTALLVARRFALS